MKTAAEELLTCCQGRGKVRCAPIRPESSLIISSIRTVVAAALIQMLSGPLVFARIAEMSVAVGMPVTRHPPHRSQACGTTALGSCLRSDAETLVRVGVQHPRGGNPLHHLSLHTFPGQAFAFLTPSAQGAQPCKANLRSEGITRFSIAGDSVVVEMALDH
jgi:hypothetical protein